MKNSNIVIILLLFVSIFSCRKEVIDIQTETETENPIEIPGYVEEVNLINGDLFGQVIDSDNNPIENAIISVSNETIATNKYGTFFLENIQMNELGTYVKVAKEGFKVAKEGYVLGTRLFYPQEGEESRIKVKLISQITSGIVQSDQGGVVEVEGGAQVNFEPSSFIRADGSEYQGEVHVITKYLNPTLASTLDEMPGDLVGIRPFENNEEVSLISYGMLLVELESEDGQKLNLAPNTNAELKLPVPQALLSSAPAEIPLWYFNEDIGRWVEEGSAILENGFYVGEVSHFSFWNCDFPAEVINLKIKLNSSDGLPVGRRVLSLQICNESNQLSGTTNANGVIRGKVPANRCLELIVKDDCGDVIHQGEIGPFDADSEIEIALNFNYEVTRISGELKCGTESSSALLVVDVGDGKLFFNVGPTFEIDLRVCPDLFDQVSCTFFDLADQKESIVYFVDVAEENDLGLVDICVEDLDEYISIKYGNDEVLFPSPILRIFDFVDPGFTEIRGQLGDVEVGLNFHGLTTGEYSGETSIEGEIFHQNTVTLTLPELTVDGLLDNFTVTEYGEVGDFIVGSFEGEMEDRQGDNQGESITIQGTFKVKVTNQEHDGTFGQFIFDRRRYILSGLTGSIRSDSDFLFRASGRNSDLLKNHDLSMTIKPNDLGVYDKVFTLFLRISSYSFFISIPQSFITEQTVTNFGEVGERVTGSAKGYGTNFFRENEETDIYISYDIRRQEDQ